MKQKNKSKQSNEWKVEKELKKGGENRVLTGILWYLERRSSTDFIWRLESQNGIRNIPCWSSNTRTKYGKAVLRQHSAEKLDKSTYGAVTQKNVPTLDSCCLLLSIPIELNRVCKPSIQIEYPIAFCVSVFCEHFSLSVPSYRISWAYSSLDLNYFPFHFDSQDSIYTEYSLRYK